MEFQHGFESGDSQMILLAADCTGTDSESPISWSFPRFKNSPSAPAETPEVHPIRILASLG